jgi:hypothetical protein
MEVPVEHSVPMVRLPEELSFPAGLAERIHFDAERGQLVFRGFMSKADFDRLCRLSDDWGYLRPLEELFRLCVPEDDAPRPGALRRLFASLAHPRSRHPSRPVNA